MNETEELDERTQEKRERKKMKGAERKRVARVVIKDVCPSLP